MRPIGLVLDEQQLFLYLNSDIEGSRKNINMDVGLSYKKIFRKKDSENISYLVVKLINCSPREKRTANGFRILKKSIFSILIKFL